MEGVETNTFSGTVDEINLRKLMGGRKDPPFSYDSKPGCRLWIAETVRLEARMKARTVAETARMTARMTKTVLADTVRMTARMAVRMMAETVSSQQE